MPNVERPDGTVHYTLEGAGPPVLMIQGVGVAGSGWEPQVRALASGFTVAAIDNRGVGGSQPCRGPITIEAMAADAAAVLDHLGWASAHVVGHSMGGVIAQQLALDTPPRVRSLSLLCTFARGRDGARLTPWVLWMTLRTRLGSRAARRRAFLEMLFPPEHLAGAREDELAREVGRIVGRDLADQPPVMMKQVMALGRHDASGRLGALAGVPALVISGLHDPIAPPKYGRQLAQRIPGARFEEWPGVSHGLPLQRPAETSERLRRFFQESEEARTRTPTAEAG